MLMLMHMHLFVIMMDKIKVYKENIYKQVPACRFIASKTDRSKYLIGELNGRPARKVYQDILNIGDKEMATQTFKNPLGKMNGQDICIISIKEVVGDKLECYRQVNDSDVLTLLELQDISHVVENTINQIKKDFTHISGVFLLIVYSDIYSSHRSIILKHILSLCPY